MASVVALLSNINETGGPTSSRYYFKKSEYHHHYSTECYYFGPFSMRQSTRTLAATFSSDRAYMEKYTFADTVVLYKYVTKKINYH